MSSLHKRILPVFLLLTLIACFLSPTANAKKPADTQPPTAPQNLAVSSVTQTSLTLSWAPSTDNKGVAAYQIFKDSMNVGTSTGTSYSVTGLTAATAYAFYVKAKDQSGNLSQPSAVLKVTTLTVIPAPAKAVQGYYAGWSAYSGYTPLSIPAAGLTAVDYAFAKIGDDLKIALGDPYIDPTNFTQLGQLKKTYPQLKTLISVGGWNDSGKFSDAALTDSSRAAFADSVVAFIRLYGFDGVDLDWEYPVGGGLSTNITRAADKTNFTLLLQKLRDKLDAQGALDGRRYLLTIAGGAGSTYASNTELGAIGRIVDSATVMTYDLHGTWDTYTDLNAPLYTPSEVSPQYKASVDAAVKTWLASGFPASKLVVGIPFYGYVYKNVTGGGTGLYDRFTGGSAVSYDSVLSTYLGGAGYTKFFHTGGQVPWLFNGSTFVSYDDETSIADKARYIVQNSLAGAAVWELSQNKGGQLLTALETNLK